MKKIKKIILSDKDGTIEAVLLKNGERKSRAKMYDDIKKGKTYLSPDSVEIEAYKSSKNKRCIRSKRDNKKKNNLK